MNVPDKVLTPVPTTDSRIAYRSVSYSIVDVVTVISVSVTVSFTAIVVSIVVVVLVISVKNGDRFFKKFQI